MQDQPHNRHVPTDMNDMTIQVEGLRWHDPISVVGAPSRSECYGVVAPPRSWGRGIRNAAHCTPSTAFLEHRHFGAHPTAVVPNWHTNPESCT